MSALQIRRILTATEELFSEARRKTPPLRHAKVTRWRIHNEVASAQQFR